MSTRREQNLKGKVALGKFCSSLIYSLSPCSLVTGSSRGIGAATVIRLAEHGADVVINYFSSEKSAEEVAEKCRSLGVRALVVQADVSKQADIVKLFDQTVDKFGRLDIVFSNSGIEHWGKPDEVDEAQFDKVISYEKFECKSIL
jgi:tetrahydroxynaphthalene reductase